MVRRLLLALAALAIGLPAAAAAEEIGRVKTVAGSVVVVRGAERLPLRLGDAVETKDVVETAADGAVGITFRDNTLVSAGPNSRLALDDYQYQPATMQGRMETNLFKGSLAVVSGDLVRGSPGAMRVRTPSTILGVRGTTFLVRVDEAPAR